MNGIDFFRHAPTAPLDRYVECLWAVRGDAPYRRSQVLPNGAVQLMLNFGAPHAVLAFGTRARRQPHARAWIAGLQEAALTIESPPATDLFSIRFRPGGASAFFGVPLDALSNAVVEADTVIGAAVDELRERLALAPDRKSQVRAAECWLLSRLQPREHEQALVGRAVALLMPRATLDDGAPVPSVRETCERLGLSNRHLIALFRRHVGLAPKTLARIGRFHAALGLLSHPIDRPRVDLALSLGYADQAHFNHEFRRFAGISPGRFLAARGEDGESLILG